MVFDINDLSKLKDFQVRLIVEDEEYEGIVSKVLLETSCVSLGKVTALHTKAFYPSLNFFGYEIESCCVIKGPSVKEKPQQKSSGLPEEEGPRLVKLRPLPIHIREKVKEENGSDNLLISGTLTDNVKLDEKDYKVPDYESEDSEDEDTIPEVFVPDRTMIIDKIDEEFHKAIGIILNHPMIGVAVEGINIGRNGKISLVTICTKTNVFIFDIYTLGERAFDRGLKDVFEKPSIMKIFHDCRQPSDAFFHQYRTKLVNIFDTQVADALIHHKNTNRMPHYVRGLGVCLLHYLQLEPKNVHFQRVRQNLVEEDLSIWLYRPLPIKLEKAAVKHVIYLRELRMVLLTQLLSELTCGVDVYLSVLRDCSEEELGLMPSTPHMLPIGFQMSYQQKQKHFNRYPNRAPSPSNDTNRFVDNRNNIQDPYITVSKGIWHYNKTPLKNDKLNKNKQDTSTNGDNKFLQGKPKSPQNQNLLQDFADTSDRNLSRNVTLDVTKSNSRSPRNSESPNEQQYKNTSSPYNKTYTPNYNYEHLKHPKKRIDWPVVPKEDSIPSKTVSFTPAGMLVASCKTPEKSSK